MRQARDSDFEIPSLTNPEEVLAKMIASKMVFNRDSIGIEITGIPIPHEGTLIRVAKLVCQVLKVWKEDDKTMIQIRLL